MKQYMVRMIIAAGIGCLSALLQAEDAKLVLTGDSNKPEMSTFIPGEPVILTFKAEGIKPDAKGLKLKLEITDAHDRKVQANELAVAPDQNGKWHTPADHRGKWVVLYFYPKDDTPGCTTQACTFRDDIFRFRAAGAGGGYGGCAGGAASGGLISSS